MVSDFSTSFIASALKSSRADSPGPSVPDRSKYPTPCLYSTTVRTGNSAGGRNGRANNKSDKASSFHMHLDAAFHVTFPQSFIRP